jgi:uncharacterized protein YndB with AHSA1/START domain
MTESHKELVITREFNAPRELLFKVFTQAEHLVNWWGPKGFKMKVAKVELKPNGIFHYCMQSPDGHEMWGKFVYKEIVEPEKLVYIVSFSDEQGNITRHPMSQTWPLETITTLTLTEENGKTKLTMVGGPYNATEEERATFEGASGNVQQGFKGTMDQLDAYLATL